MLRTRFDEIVKSKKTFLRHSGEGRARSEALALSSGIHDLWTPAFAGVTGCGTTNERKFVGYRLPLAA